VLQLAISVLPAAKKATPGPEEMAARAAAVKAHVKAQLGLEPNNDTGSYITVRRTDEIALHACAGQPARL
jgi:hypothetical protein